MFSWNKAAMACLIIAGLIGPAMAQVPGSPESYTPQTTPYTGTEAWFCSRPGPVKGRCDANDLFSSPAFVSSLASPPCIGCSVPGAIAATALSASGAVSGAGFSNYFAAPPPFGSLTPNTAAATMLSASSSNGGYLTTTIDSRNNNTNGILVSGASSTLAQEITQSPLQIAWNPGFTGSPGGTFNTAGLTVTTTSTKTDQIYPWGIIGVVKNFTDVATPGNPNAVAINGTTFTYPVTASSASSSWGGNFVVDESNAAGITDPTLGYRIGTELDVYLNAADTTDINLKRIGLLIGVGPTSASTAVHGCCGIDISPGLGTLDYGIIFWPQGGATGNITTIIENPLSASHFTNFLVSPGFVVDNAGNTTANTMKLVSMTFATLPTCNAGSDGTVAYITDASATPAYNATVSAGGGSNRTLVLCRNSAWTFH
jgi:hypothetical protein